MVGIFPTFPSAKDASCERIWWIFILQRNWCLAVARHVLPSSLPLSFQCPFLIRRKIAIPPCKSTVGLTTLLSIRAHGDVVPPCQRGPMWKLCTAPVSTNLIQIFREMNTVDIRFMNPIACDRKRRRTQLHAHIMQCMMQRRPN